MVLTVEYVGSTPGLNPGEFGFFPLWTWMSGVLSYLVRWKLVTTWMCRELETSGKLQNRKFRKCDLWNKVLVLCYALKMLHSSHNKRKKMYCTFLFFTFTFTRTFNLIFFLHWVRIFSHVLCVCRWGLGKYTQRYHLCIKLPNPYCRLSHIPSQCRYSVIQKNPLRLYNFWVHELKML